MSHAKYVTDISNIIMGSINIIITWNNSRPTVGDLLVPIFVSLSCFHMHVLFLT